MGKGTHKVRDPSIFPAYKCKKCARSPGKYHFEWNVKGKGVVAKETLRLRSEGAPRQS